MIISGSLRGQINRAARARAIGEAARHIFLPPPLDMGHKNDYVRRGQFSNSRPGRASYDALLKCVSARSLVTQRTAARCLRARRDRLERDRKLSVAFNRAVRRVLRHVHLIMGLS